MLWIAGIGVFLLLLFVFPRQMLGLLALILTAGGLWWLYYSWSSENARREIANIQTVASYDIATCSPKFPVMVAFKNNGRQTIKKLFFSIYAHRDGYSDDVYSDVYKSSDRIVEPGKGHVVCWALDPYDVQDGLIRGIQPSTLRWRAEVESATFQ